MATRDELRALLAVTCPWCHAAAGELCSTMGVRNDQKVGPRRSDRRRIRTLDGGCHDARWNKALGTSAPVLPEVVAAGHQRPVVDPEEGQRVEEPVLVGAAVERPW